MDRGILRFPPTGSWSSWASQSLRIPLNSGTNTLRLLGTQAPGPNLDHVNLRLESNAGTVSEVSQDAIPKPANPAPDSGDATRDTTNSQPLEAEDATLVGGVVVATKHPGYTGSGFADYPAAGGEAHFTMTGTLAGDYELGFRYANGSTTARELRLQVNGVDRGILRFPPTATWSSWASQSLRIPLNSGTNALRLLGTQAPGPNLDHMHPRLLPNPDVMVEAPKAVITEPVDKAPAQIDSVPASLSYNSQTLEAEQSSLGGGVVVATKHPGYTGSGFADYPAAGGEAHFTMTGTLAGDYELGFRYANGSTTARELRLLVNGVDRGILRFPPTGGWSSWTSQSLRIPLNSGTNTLRLLGTQAPGPNLDHILTSLVASAPLQCDIEQSRSSRVSANASFNAALQPAATYRWNFGDHSAEQTGANVFHRFLSPGRYSVLLTVSNGQQTRQCSITHTVHHTLTGQAPSASSGLIIDERTALVWNVNPDNNSVSAVHQHSHTKAFEVSVGQDPRSLAQAGDGSIWVTNFDSASVSILDPDDGALIDTLELPYASQPVAIAFTPNGQRAFISLQALGRIISVETSTRAVGAGINLGPDPQGLIPKVRGLAVSGDGNQLLATRFISQNEYAEVFSIDANTLQWVRTFRLEHDPGNGGALPDDTFNSRGLPNYLNSVRISPDGRRAWVSAKKDNIQRGLFRDGRRPSFDSTTRTILAPLDLTLNREILDQRIDLNDSDLAIASVFSPLGDLLFVAVQGNNEVQVYDSHNGELQTTIRVGSAPQALALDSNGQLFVHNFLSRSLSVINVTGLLDGSGVSTPVLAAVNLVGNEALRPNVLQGKRIFYNASSRAMSRDNYLSCASCHLDGGEDGRVFDFTHRGEGLRNTISLRGRRGTGHGRVHWTGTFDEIQDFENDIRAHFGGLGFMSDADFFSGTRSEPLGDPKAGPSFELNALSAYVTSLDAVPASPYRAQGGELTADGRAGETIYRRLNCVSCHAGSDFTDSARNSLHDVDTAGPGSGARLGRVLTGLDTPTLKGVWNTAPYLHDGSAATLYDVIENLNHGNAALLGQAEKDRLVAYLLQLDESSTNVE